MQCQVKVKVIYCPMFFITQGHSEQTVRKRVVKKIKYKIARSKLKQQEERFTCIYIYELEIYIYIHTHIYIYTYTHTYIHTYIYVYRYIYIYIYTYTHIRIYLERHSIHNTIIREHNIHTGNSSRILSILNVQVSTSVSGRV